MPFCTQCGHEAGGKDAFCGHCGARQSAAGWSPGNTPPGNAPPRPNIPPTLDPLAGLSPRTAAILCYIPAVGWIAAIIVLAARRFKDNHLIRFHAFQGLYLFAAWLIVDWVIGPIVRAAPGHHFPLDTILHGVILFVSIFMMVKASHDEAYVLPIIGELAQRSATEQ
jgi:uncharacterized membrane protein